WSYDLRDAEKLLKKVRRIRRRLRPFGGKPCWGEMATLLVTPDAHTLRSLRRRPWPRSKAWPVLRKHLRDSGSTPDQKEEPRVRAGAGLGCSQLRRSAMWSMAKNNYGPDGGPAQPLRPALAWLLACSSAAPCRL